MTRRSCLAASLVAAVLRAALIVFAMHTGGALHATLDLSRAFGAAVEDHHDCPDDDDGRECPPACPLCHCARTIISPLPDGVGPVVVAALPDAELGRAPPERAHRPPDLDGIYRPPRARA